MALEMTAEVRQMSQERLKVNYCHLIGVENGTKTYSPYLDKGARLEEARVSSATVKRCLHERKYQLRQFTNHLWSWRSDVKTIAQSC